MAHIVKDRIRETTNTIGIGPITLLGAVTNHRSFYEVCNVGDTVYYAIVDQTNNGWETGFGTYTSSNVLTRTSVISSSNSGLQVSFSSGTKDVFLTQPATLDGIVGPGKSINFFENDSYIDKSRIIGESSHVSATISITSPAIITAQNNYIVGQPVWFMTNGALPTNFNEYETYYVLASGLTNSSFQVSSSFGGSALNATGIQSGLHTVGKLMNAGTFGPVTIADDVVVTIPTGATWSIA